MYYTVESGTGTITTTELTDNAKGTMNNTKTLAITIQNNNTSQITIKVATKGALINSSITLAGNEYEFLTDTTPPTVTVTAVDNNTTNAKLSITSNEDGTYCVNTSSTTTDMSSCVFSGSIIANTAITTGVFTTATTYYVHVKDSAGNIGISSKISISFDYIASSFAKEKYGTGGLVAINTSGTLYSGSGTIREYRYSGRTVYNYVFFDTDGDSVKDTNEIWRIVGIFKNSSGNWNLKLMRNTILSRDELPSTYAYGTLEFRIESSSTGTGVMVNSLVDGVERNTNWTTAGLQYYLNGTDGYFGTLSSKSRALVDTSYTYYLGNYIKSSATAISGYTDERNASNISQGNKATWKGKVALLYPSDYGYSASSSYWSSTILNDYGDGAMNTSWMYKTANPATYEWFLNPSSSSGMSNWLPSGAAYSSHFGSTGISARPVLNLKSTTPIDINHTGSSSDPYIIIGS